MPKLLSLLALVLAAGLFALGGAASAQTEPIKIGFGGALSGNQAAYGRSNLFGIEYAVIQQNAKGGLLGRPVELVQADDSCDPALATAAASKLKSEGLTLILGHSCSGATRSALSVYQNSAIVISASATENSLTFDGLHPYFFRTTPYDSAQSGIQASLIASLGLSKVAVLHERSDYGKSMADFTASYLRELPGKPVQIVMEEGVDAGQTSYDSLAAAIKGSGAQAVVWSGYFAGAAKLSVSLRDQGANVIFIGGDGVYNMQYMALAGPSSEGAYVTGQTDFSVSEAAKAAIADHRSRHKEVIGTYFFYSVAAAQALFSAVEKAGGAADLDLIKKHLTEDTAETILGPVRFDSRGDRIGATFKLYRVVNGQFAEYSIPAPPPSAAPPEGGSSSAAE